MNRADLDHTIENHAKAIAASHKTDLHHAFLILTKTGAGRSL